MIRATVAALLLSLSSVIHPAPTQADPDALWTIVHGSCIPDEQQHDDPAPCALVDLTNGEQHGYAVLKDINGANQFLLIPTERIAGIESPAIAQPDATNYFAAAWRARSFVQHAAGHKLPRDWLSLAINSQAARSQDELHVHIDCIRADVHDALTEQAGEVGGAWTPFPVPLAGHHYSAFAIKADDLDAVNPFTVLADGLPGARDDMARQTLAAVGITAGGGFLLLASRADDPAGGTGSAEDLQDHASCPSADQGASESRPPPASQPIPF
jgi:CDP-diacylglycerol pyrophosphatase